MYHVVFEYTKETKGYQGVRTRTAFRSEEEFTKWFTPQIQKTHKVVGQGISDDEATSLIKQTPLECYLASCIQEATNPKTGEVNQRILEMKLMNVAYAIAS